MAEANSEVVMENGDQQQLQDGEGQQPMEEGGTQVEGEGGDVEAEGDKKDQPRNRPAGRTIIIKNLPASLLLTLQDVLKEKFDQYGELQYVRLGGITVDFDTIVPTLSAYINYADPECSEKAMVENGSEIDGCPIQMQILKTSEHTMVVSNIPYTITEDCIRSLFSSCGNISKVIKIPARPTVFVEFETEEGLQQALSLNGTLVVNNIELLLQKQGEEKKPLVKQKKMKTKGQRNREKGKGENGDNTNNTNNTVQNTSTNNTGTNHFQGNRNKNLRGGMGNNKMIRRGGNRMGGGGMGMGMGMGMMGNNRNWGGGGNMGWGMGMGMGYNNWDNLSMNYNNSWGNNGNNFGGGNNAPRGNKKRKNDWWQY